MYNHSSMASVKERFSSDIIDLTREVFSEETEQVLSALQRPVEDYSVRCNTLRIEPEKLAIRLEALGMKVRRNQIIPEALKLHTDRLAEIRAAGKVVVADKCSAESILQGADLYAQGVLSCHSIRRGDHVTVLSEFGDILGSGIAAMSEHEILTLRAGLAVQLQHSGARMISLRRLDEFSKGLLYPQSLPSMVTVRVLDPHRDETIVDMTCAPGGKLSHISQLMDGSGRVLAFDRNREKLAKTRQTLRRFGCSNVMLSIQDSRYLDKVFPNLRADRVLLDPPCSALGVRPKIYDFKDREHISSLAEYQKQFLKTASRIVKENGVIVYSVCTFTLQECEMIVDFAERECGLRTMRQEPFLASKGLRMVGDSGSLCQRFRPDVDGSGYFIAKFERRKPN